MTNCIILKLKSIYAYIYLQKINNKGNRGYWDQKKDYASDIINWPEDYESGV